MPGYDSLTGSGEENGETGSGVKAALRTAFVVAALSFHSLLEGLALGLDATQSGVWMNAAATALHKAQNFSAFSASSSEFCVYRVVLQWFW